MSTIDMFGSAAKTKARASAAPLDPGAPVGSQSGINATGYVLIGEPFITIRGTEIPGPDGPVASYEINREYTCYGNLCAGCAIKLGSKAKKIADLASDFRCDEHERERQRQGESK